MLRRIAIGGTSLTVASSIAGYAFVQSDPGLQRQAQFYSRSAHIIAHYTFVFYFQNRKEKYDELNKLYAPQALKIVRELKGMFIKAAQIASVRPEFVPEAYREALSELRSNVPPEDFSVIKDIIEKDFGRPIDAVFASFETTPVGSASVGQAHVATLAGSGEQVVVKVQYPNARVLFGADLSCLELLVYFTNPEALPLFREYTKQYLKELDFVGERRNLVDTYNAVMPTFSSVVAIPKVFEAYSSEHVITMEYLQGPKLDTEVMRSLKAVGISVEGQGSFKEWMTAKQKSQQASAVGVPVEEGIEDGGVGLMTGGGDGDDKDGGGMDMRAFKIPHYAIWISNYVDVLWLIRLVESVTREVKSISAFTVRRIFGRTPWSDKVLSDLERYKTVSNLGELLRTLIKVHGFEIFCTVVFNGDPHPGNILLLPDNRIGLIDYGQCTRLDNESRFLIAKIVTAVAEKKDDATLAAVMRDCGFKSKNDSDYFLAIFARLLFGPIKLEYMDREFHLKLRDMDRVTAFPSSILMVVRVLTLLRGLGLVFRYNVDVADNWKPYADRSIANGGAI